MTLKVRDVLHTSSLPSILDSYVPSERFGTTAHMATTLTQFKKLQARKDKEAVLHTGTAADADEMAEAKQKALLDQRHLETYYRIHRLRDRLYRHYTELLRDKVKRQREEIKLRDLKKRTKHNEQRTRKLTIQKLPVSSLHHDDAFLRALPKTRHYLILELQRLLGQHGCLQGPKEQEAFQYWVNHHRTAQLEKQIQQMVLCCKPAEELKFDFLKKKQEALPKIQVSIDESPTQQEQTAVSESGGGEQPNSPRLLGKQSQEHEHAKLKFPSILSQELQVPRFATLQPHFLEMFKTNFRLLRVKEPLSKSNAAAMTHHKLRLMHSLSLSHMAHTRRLLDRNELTLQYDDGDSISDLLERMCLTNTKESTCPGFPSLPPVSLRENPEQFMEKPITPSGQVTSARQSEDSEISYYEASNSEVPLSMEDIYPHSILLGKDFKEKTWTNYIL